MSISNLQSGAKIAHFVGRDKRVPGIPVVNTESAKRFLALRPDFIQPTEAGLERIAALFSGAQTITLEAIDAEPQSPEAHLYIEIELQDWSPDAENALIRLWHEWLRNAEPTYRRRVVVDFRFL